MSCALSWGAPRAMATLWVGKTSSTLPGGRPCRVRVRTVPHCQTCLTAYDPHSSRPQFFKSGHAAWHGTKESTWYLARNYHEPSTVPARKRATGPSQPEPGICTVLSCPSRLVRSTLSCFGSGSRVRPMWPHCAYHSLTVRDRWLLLEALLCFPVYPPMGPALPLPSASLNCVSSFLPQVDMPLVFWAAPCVRIYYIQGHVRAHARCCCSCMPAPTFTTTKGQAFLTVPSFHQRSLSPCASRRTNSPTGLLGRLRLFMNRTPPISSPSACRRTPTHPLLSLSASSPFSSSLEFSFLSVAQPRSLTLNCRHRQSHLD